MTVEETENGEYKEGSEKYIPKRGFVVFPENEYEEIIIDEVLESKEAFEQLIKDAIKRGNEG